MKKIFLLLLLLSSFSLIYAQTIEELRDSMAAGNLNMQVDLAIRYIYGDGVNQDSQEALRLIQDAADKGNRYGELWLGICLEQGIGLEKNQEKAFQCYVNSAQKGNLMASFLVGQAYEYGMGVEPNKQEAFRNYQESANGNYAPAMDKMAGYYLYGRDVERDLVKSFELTKQAADTGYDEALFNLTKYYFNGWGTKEDKSEALRIMNQLKDKEDFYNSEAASKFADIIEKGDTMGTYEFQFRFIPSIVQSYKKGDDEYDELLNITGWEIGLRSIFISHFEWDWKEVYATVHEIDSTTIILYHMPNPERPPLCLYAAAVVNKEHHSCRYYTLEKTINLFDEEETPWVVGGQDENTHLNYGHLQGKPTEENFLKKVCELSNCYQEIPANVIRTDT